MRTFAVALGGAAGALGRYALTRELPPASTGFPTATFLVNLVGALAIGFFLGWWERASRTGTFLPPFVAVGIIGGLTTFSTLAVEVVDRLDKSSSTVALAYLGLSLVGSLVLVSAGASAGRRLRAPR